MHSFTSFTLKSGVTAQQVDGTTNIIPGWVTGDISGLAASTSVDVWFDLGKNWDKYDLVQVANSDISGSSGISISYVRSSDNLTADAADYSLGPAASTGWSSMSSASAANARSGFVRPMARYMYIRVANADAVNPVGAGAWMAITAYVNGG